MNDFLLYGQANLACLHTKKQIPIFDSGPQVTFDTGVARKPISQRPGYTEERNDSSARDLLAQKVQVKITFLLNNKDLKSQRLLIIDTFIPVSIELS